MTTERFELLTARAREDDHLDLVLEVILDTCNRPADPSP
jgi:hypothetical protein